MRKIQGPSPASSLLLPAVVGALLFTLQAWAANDIQVPLQTNPGLLLPSSPNAKLLEQRPEENPQKPAQVEITPPFDLNTSSHDAEKYQSRVFVSTIVIAGSTLLTPEQTNALTEPCLNKMLTWGELENLVDKINAIYRQKGYLTTQVYIPPQRIDNGTIEIKVAEGRVGKVSVVGNKYYRVGAIERNVKLYPGELFDVKGVEKRINRSNQNNNFAVRAILAPGEETGETDVRLETVEQRPWQIAPNFDNLGRPGIGTYRWGMDVTNNSLFGIGDRLATSYVGAAGTRAMLSSYYLPIGSKGDELEFNYGLSHVNVFLPNAPNADITGRANALGVSWIHPFNESRTWTGDVGVQERRVQSFINDERTNLNQIHTLVAGLSFNKQDRFGRTYARLQGSTGMGLLGGNSLFSKSELFLTRLTRLPKNNLLLLRGYGQVTSDALPSAEAFQLGGEYSVRGYSQGLLLGDRGYNLSVEDRFPLPMMQKTCPWLSQRIQGAAFFDMGQAWYDKSNIAHIAGASRVENTQLLGTGVGLRIRLTQYLQGYVDFGFGLSNPVTGDHPMRIHVGVRSNLMPEGYRKFDPNAQPVFIPPRDSRISRIPIKLMPIAVNTTP